MANVVIYDPNSSIVTNRVTNYLLSVNTPDYGSTGDIINPDVDGLTGIAFKYWKATGETGEETVVEMTTNEKTSVDNYLKAKTFREKLYKILKYDVANQLEKETWYDTDNGDGTYAGKAEETTYVYSNSKLISKTVIIYYFDGTQSSTTVYEYYVNAQNEIIEKQVS